MVLYVNIEKIKYIEWAGEQFKKNKYFTVENVGTEVRRSGQVYICI